MHRDITVITHVRMRASPQSPRPCPAEVRGEASEADAEAKRLAGVGMANMRAAMAQGFQDSMKFMKVLLIQCECNTIHIIYE